MKKGFTLIELLIIITIISLLAVAIFVSVDQARKKARLNGAKSSMKSVLPAIIACSDSGGAVNAPGSGGGDICQAGSGLQNAKWPVLAHGYTYDAVGGDYSSSCSFTVNTNTDTTKLGYNYLTCSCVIQTCE